MKVYFAPDTGDNPNWGCRIMAAWLRETLRAEGADPLVRTGSQWFTRPPEGMPVPADLAQLQQVGRDVGRGAALPEVAQVLSSCDLVYLNGENYIRPGVRKGRVLLLMAYLAKVVFNKPCVLANHSADLGDPGLREMATEVYGQLDEVHFREPTSLERYGQLVPEARRRLVPDVAWALPAAPLADWRDQGRRLGHFDAWPDLATGFDPGRPYVTVCASSAYGVSGAQGPNPIPAFIALCQRLRDEFGQVVLAAPCEPDQRIMREVQARLSLPLLGIHLPVRQAVDVIGNALVHVGGRWHPGIFAAGGGTPQVMIGANNHKMHSLARQLDMPAPVFDPMRLDCHVDDMLVLARRLVAEGPKLRAQLKERSRQLAARVGDGMEFVRNLRTSGR